MYSLCTVFIQLIPKIKPQRTQRAHREALIARKVSLRGMPKASEAIPMGMASTILPTYGPELFYHEEHEENNGIKVVQRRYLKFGEKDLF